MVTPMGLVVGFDLDMTLVDSADGITAALAETGRVFGVPVEQRELRHLIGLPLERTLGYFIEDGRIDEAKAIYRGLYPALGVPAAKLLPGAAEAVEAIHRNGGVVAVISAKIETAVRAVLDHVELVVDDVVGERYAETKGAALRKRQADVYVGDHPGDMIGACSGGAYAVGVTTGFHDAVALREAGADVVFTDLLDFPYWLDDFVGNPT